MKVGQEFDTLKMLTTKATHVVVRRATTVFFLCKTVSSTDACAVCGKGSLCSARAFTYACLALRWQFVMGLFVFMQKHLALPCPRVRCGASDLQRPL